MPTLRTRIGLGVLIVLVATLGYRVWSRGLGLRLGAPASTLAGPHRTEAQWAAAEVVTNLAEMLRYASDAAARPGEVTVEVTPAGTGFQARVTWDGHTVDAPIDGRDGVWSVAAYAPIASRLLRELRLSPAPPSRPDTDPLFAARLLDADAAALERESERLGMQLGAQMLDAGRHEHAALLLVAFSLREAAERLSDDRPQLLRILAHLSMAAALRGDANPSPAAAAASAYADHLAGRGLDASRALAALGTTPTGADAAWVRVLLTRIDEDWRRPAARSLVERREYFRARLRAVGSSQVVSELEADGPHQEADWGRIVRQDLLRVDDGELATEGLASERAEMASVWRVTHGGDKSTDPIAVLDGARIGAMTSRGPRPLSWGLWSRFFERHLVAFAARIDTYYRHSMADNDAAERVGAELDTLLGNLDFHPAATTFRTRGVANGDADLTRIAAAITLTLRRPELVPAAVWAWLEYAQKYEPIARGMPSAAAWFAKPASRIAAFDLSRRLESTGHALNAAELEALWREAPADYTVARVNLDRRYLGKATPAEVRTLLAPRLPYDVRARRRLAEATVTPAERVALEEGTCAIDVESCFALARALVEAGRDADAAAVYQRTIADGRIGEVVIAHHAGWLIDYWRRTGRQDQALRLADRAARTGSSRGVSARAWLFEQLDRLEDAETDYTSLAERYGEHYQPLGFYYRMARVRKAPGYESGLQALLPQLFPRGLQPLGPSDGRQAPSSAVQITKDSALSRRFGMQAGDLIVGLDGWRVENLKQYQAVRAFSTDDRMRVVLWRGARLDVEARAEHRWFDIGLRSYPIQGWAE